MRFLQPTRTYVARRTMEGKLGPANLAGTTAPIADAVSAQGRASPVVRVGAAVAALGALLGLIAGVGRTTLAMARHNDLPSWLGAVHPRHQVPHHAEITLAVVVCGVLLVADLRGAIGFSSFGVLLYYLVANLAAWTQPRPQRRYPRALQILGAIGCLALVATLPVQAVIGGIIMFAVGIMFRGFRLVRTRSGR